MFYHSNPCIPITSNSFNFIGSGYYYCCNDGEVYRTIGITGDDPMLVRTKRVQAPSCYETFSFFPEQSRKSSPLIKTNFGYLRRVDNLYYERGNGLSLSFINRRIHNPVNHLFMSLNRSLNIRTTIAAMAVLKEPITVTYFEEFFRDINLKNLLDDQFDHMTVSLIPKFITHSFKVPQFFNEVFNDWYLLRTIPEEGLYNKTFLIPKALFIPSIKNREGLIHFIVTMIYYAATWHYLHFMCDTAPEVTTMSIEDILGVSGCIPSKLLNVQHFAATKINLDCSSTISSEVITENIEDLFVFMKQFFVVFYLIPNPIKTNKTIKDLYEFLTEILGNDISLEKCNEVYPLIQSYIENLFSQIVEYATVDDVCQPVLGVFNKNQVSLTELFLKITLVPFPVHGETPIFANIHPTLLQLFCAEAEVQKRILKESAEIALLGDKLKTEHLEGHIKIYEKLIAVINSFINQ